jgi:hypothetical protein
MANDVTANTGAAYLAVKRTFEDLSRLAGDFGEAVRQAGYEWSNTQEYSPGQNSLVLKKHHAWLFTKAVDESEPKESRVLHFVSCCVYFEGDRSKGPRIKDLGDLFVARHRTPV